VCAKKLPTQAECALKKRPTQAEHALKKYLLRLSLCENLPTQAEPALKEGLKKTVKTGKYLLTLSLRYHFAYAC
jgi:hypothetical protein